MHLPEPHLARYRRQAGLWTRGSRRQHAVEIVEGRSPALFMRSLRFLVPQPPVREHNGRGSVGPLVELDLDDLGALVLLVPILGPGEDKMLGRRDLDVFAAAAKLLAVWTA